MATARRRSQAWKGIRAAVTYALYVFVLLLWAFPVIWVLLTSLKRRTDMFTLPPTLIFEPTLEHYVEALTSFDIVHSVFNSAVVAFVTMALTLALAVPAGYAFSRVQFRLSRELSFFALLTQMAPPLAIVIPYFFLLNQVRMLDTYTGLIATHITLTLPFSIWLMITYFQDIPRALEESAAIDGVSPFNSFFKVILPNAMGGVGVTAIFSFIESWNNFEYAVVLSGTDTKTAPVAIFGFLAAEESRWGPFTATGVLIMGPVIVVALIAQRQLIRGLTIGATKG